jgi:hypothetical protein
MERQLDPTKGQIKALNSFPEVCLHVRNNFGAKASLLPCEPNLEAQQILYDPTTGLLQLYGRACLRRTGEAANFSGVDVEAADCNAAEEAQRWTYRSDTRQIQSIGGYCLDAGLRHNLGLSAKDGDPTGPGLRTDKGLVQMLACDATNKNQQWTISLALAFSMCRDCSLCNACFDTAADCNADRNAGGLRTCHGSCVDLDTGVCAFDNDKTNHKLSFLQAADHQTHSLRREVSTLASRSSLKAWLRSLRRSARRVTDQLSNEGMTKE